MTLDIQEFIKKARQIETMVYKQQELCNQLNNTLKKRKQKQQQEYLDLLPMQDYTPRSAYRACIGRIVCTFLGICIGLIKGLRILSESEAANYAAYKVDGIIRSGASESAETESFVILILAVALGFFIGLLIDIIIYRGILNDDKM